MPGRLRTGCDFYPRPPRGGRPINARVSAQCNTNFYPCPPRGGRPKLKRRMTIKEIFLSTPSARRATSAARRRVRPKAISIHALREEGDLWDWGGAPAARISIHALREEGDRGSHCAVRPRSYFYPRPPRGGRHFDALVDRNLLTFLSTPSARRATAARILSPLRINDFYPRPPRGGRLSSVRSYRSPL